MRLQLIGNYTLSEFKEAILKIAEDLENHKIESVRSVSIYLRPCVQGSEIQLMDEDREVQHMVYDFRKKRKIVMLSDL